LQRIIVVFIEEYRSRPSAFGPASREDWPLRACKSGTTLNSERRAAGVQSIIGPSGEGNAMATFVVLYKYTEQGIKTIKDAPKRLEAAKKATAQAGLTNKEALWLQGEYDFMAIVEGDEIAATAFNINILKQGNLHSHTMRAFTAAEMTKILERVA
jgi:uncharacterized protein with GYD domain